MFPRRWRCAIWIRGSPHGAICAFLRERFDEDWWRNPRALVPLQGLWSRGGRPTAAELWREISAEPSVEPLAQELARVCQ
jgi:hypothetical protein